MLTLAAGSEAPRPRRRPVPGVRPAPPTTVRTC